MCSLNHLVSIFLFIFEQGDKLKLLKYIPGSFDTIQIEKLLNRKISNASKYSLV